MYFQTQSINGTTELAAISPTKKRGWEKIQSITVIGKRHTDTNTYHTVLMLVNGVCVYQSPVTYGYENAYEQTAEQHICKFSMGKNFFTLTSLGRWCKEHNINYFVTCADVRTKKEL
jgi:hypothetical protein